MKKLFLSLLANVVIMTATASNIIWAKTDGLKITTTSVWPNNWDSCAIDIKIDLDHDMVVIYSETIQIFTIEEDSQSYIKDSNKVFKYECLDINSKRCNLYFIYNNNLKQFISIIIEYADGKYAYKLQKN